MPDTQLDPKTTKIVVEIDEGGEDVLVAPLVPSASSLGLAANRTTPKQKRHRPRPKGDKVYFRFFDVNWKKFGDNFAELPFNARFVSQLVDDGGKVIQADYDQLNSLVFATPIKDFAKTFKNTGDFITEFHNEKIHNDYFPLTVSVFAFSGTSSFQYQLEEFAADNTRSGWDSDKGLALSKDDVQTAKDAESLTVFTIIGNGNSTFDLLQDKITETNNFDAPGVDLELKGTFDIFILPKIVLTNGIHSRSFKTIFTPVPPDAWVRVLMLYNATRLTFRRPFYDATSPFYKFKILSDGYAYGDNLAAMNETAKVLANIPGNRTTIIDQDADGHGSYNPAIYTEGDGLAFLSAPNPPEGTIFHQYQVQYFTPIRTDIVAHRLQCVIIQGEKTYYLWEEF